MHRHADEGSATIWTLGVALVVVSIVYAALMVCVAIATRHRAEAAADLAALAAATAAQTGADACAAAARVAMANAARVATCVILADRSVRVGIELAVPKALARWAPTAVHASARAGQ